MFLYPIKQVILSGGFKKCVQLFFLFIVIEHVKILNKKREEQINAFPLKILYMSCTIVYFVKLIEGCVKYPPTIN